MDRLKYFNNELELITSTIRRKFAIFCIERLPEYFFIVPASSSLKYHPLKARQLHGLVYHTKLAISCAMAIGTTYKINDNDVDIIVVSLLLHDGLKKNIPEEQHTNKMHPLLVSNWIRTKMLPEFIDSNMVNYPATIEDLIEFVNEVCKCIESHMGQWTCKGLLPEPILGDADVLPLIVHQGDYLASKYDKLDVEMPEDEE